MTTEELRDALYDIVLAYFSGADVVWGKTNRVKSPHPLICLDMGTQRRVYQPIKIMDVDTEKTYIQATTPLIVELFTHGKKCTHNGQKYYINTAVSDMNDFLNYLESEHVTTICDRLNINILPNGEVLDTSAVQDNDYEYRARAEIEIDYLIEYYGGAGISRVDWKQTASGGGSEELASEKTGIIETAEIKEE